MSNVSIAGYAGWPTYDTFLIVSLSSRPVYDPNPLRSNPNPKKPVLGSCRVRGLGRTLTPLTYSPFVSSINQSSRPYYFSHPLMFYHIKLPCCPSSNTLKKIKNKNHSFSFFHFTSLKTPSNKEKCLCGKSPLHFG